MQRNREILLQEAETLFVLPLLEANDEEGLLKGACNVQEFPGCTALLFEENGSSMIVSLLENLIFHRERRIKLN